MGLREMKLRSLGNLLALIVMFILGMILNLWVKLPDMHPGNTGSTNYFVRSLHSYGWGITIGGGVTLFLHVLLGTGLLIGGVIFLVRAIMSHQKAWIWVGSLGLLGILMAFGNGLSFLDYNHDVSSFLMALGFCLAIAAYAFGLAWPLTSKAPAK